jgi:hypothetical protein
VSTPPPFPPPARPRSRCTVHFLIPRGHCWRGEAYLLRARNDAPGGALPAWHAPCADECLLPRGTASLFYQAGCGACCLQNPPHFASTPKDKKVQVKNTSAPARGRRPSRPPLQLPPRSPLPAGEGLLGLERRQLRGVRQRKLEHLLLVGLLALALEELAGLCVGTVGGGGERGAKSGWVGVLRATRGAWRERAPGAARARAHKAQNSAQPRTRCWGWARPGTPAWP